MDTSNLVVENTSNIVVENTSNIIIMDQKMCIVQSYMREKHTLQSTIQEQSAEIGRLLNEVNYWKGMYEEIYSKIIV